MGAAVGSKAPSAPSLIHSKLDLEVRSILNYYIHMYGNKVEVKSVLKLII